MKTSGTRRYAETTKVPIAKTRGEIDALLRKWGCGQVAWLDDWDRGHMALQFRWKHEGDEYVARFGIQLPSDDELWKAMRGNRSNYNKALAKRGFVEARQLLLWLKASFNAVEAGIIEPAQIFMPWLVTSEGDTLYTRMLPRLGDVTRGASAHHLLQIEQ